MNLGTMLRTQWDRIAGVALAVAGAAAMTLAAVGVSGTKVVADQVSYLVSGGLVGLFLLGLGATLWLSADLHDEWARLDGIGSALAPRAQANPSAGPEITLDDPACPKLEATGVRHG